MLYCVWLITTVIILSHNCWIVNNIFPTFVGFYVFNNYEVMILYISANTAERIKELAKSKKIPINVLLTECGLSKNALSSMLSRGSWLQANNLAKIADYLDCSVDYLLGRTEVLETKISSSPTATDERAVDELINLALEQLTDSELAEVHAFVEDLLKNRKV